MAWIPTALSGRTHEQEQVFDPGERETGPINCGLAVLPCSVGLHGIEQHGFRKRCTGDEISRDDETREKGGFPISLVVFLCPFSDCSLFSLFLSAYI